MCTPRFCPTHHNLVAGNLGVLRQRAVKLLGATYAGGRGRLAVVWAGCKEPQDQVLQA